MNNFVIYEIPFTEKMRILIKLEECFAQVKYNLHGTTKWNAKTCLINIMEILSLLDKHDVKNLLLKDIERLEQSYISYINVAEVDQRKLRQTLDDLKYHWHQLNKISNKVARQLLENDDLLSSVKQRIIGVNQVHSYEIPSLYHWLQQSPNYREAKIRVWLDSLHELHAAADFLTQLIRTKSDFQLSHAEVGSYQYTLPQSQNCQLVRLQLPIDTPIFPEVSGNKNRVNIRFLTYIADADRPAVYQDHVDFELAICS